MTKPTSTYSIKLPTKKYLKKYILVKFGQELNFNTTLGTLILCLLDKRIFDINLNREGISKRLQYFNTHIIFSVQLSTMKYKGHSLSDDKVIAINRFIEDLFVEDLYRHCKENKKKELVHWRPGIDKAIHSFAAMYGIIIDEDVTFDALKKAEYRYRKDFQEKSQTFVPPHSRPSTMYSFS